MSVLEGVPLEKLRFTTRIKLELGSLFLSAAVKLIPHRPFWEEVAIQILGEIKGGSTKDEANQRHKELEARLAAFKAGRSREEWEWPPPKADGE